MKLTINSLSLRIGLTMVAVISIFGVLALWATYNFSVTRFAGEKESSLMMAVDHGSQILGELFSQSQDLVKMVASDKRVVGLMDAGDKNNVEDMIGQLNNYNSSKMYSAVYLVDSDGLVIASTDLTFMGQNYGFREYFARAMRGEAVVDVNLGVTSKKLGYYFSYPIVNKKDKIIGVAVLKMNPEVIDEKMKLVMSKPLSDLMLTDKYGVVVNSSQKERIYQSLGNLSVIEKNKIETENKYGGVNILPLQYEQAMKLVRDKTGEIKSINIDDKVDKGQEIMVVSPIRDLGFYLVGEISINEIASQAAETARIIGLMIILTIMSSMAMIVLLTAKMLSPIGKLTKMARDIGMGKFNQTTAIGGGGELGVLANSMINMANELGGKYSDLENMVSIRTAKMEEQNETLEKGKMAILNILDDVAMAKTDLEKFKLAVENASDHIVITDSEGIILYANKAVEKITGFTNQEVVGKKAGNKQLWGGLMDKSFYEKMWKIIKIDKQVFSGEVNNKRKSGEKYVAIASISPIIGKDGEVEFFVGIERDVTHEKEVDRMKTDFISLASHQLRTPLSAMRWFAEMLLAGDAGKLSKQQEEFVKNIEQANSRMIVLVNSLLNISRIESGRIVVDPEPTDLKKLVEDQLLELDNNIKEKKQTVVVSVNKKLPKINIDPKLIREVYKNLLTNANKYSPEGSEIDVFISHKDKEIVSQVSDSGMGIPKASQKRIFERFYRAENVVKLETEGTGLGLYLARAIVESSGGKMWFKSEEGKGTSFWFSLPTAGVKKKEGEVTINS